MNQGAKKTLVTTSAIDYLPLVSIGIPTFNRPEGLRRTLECITAQTYRHLEIIVSDNASPGSATELVAREFMALDSRVRFFRQTENRGHFFNFQFVLKKATGEYFMWAADDDLRDSKFVSALLIKIVGQPDVAIAFCNFHELDESGHYHSAYPEHLTLLRPFTTTNSWLRLWRYFIQDERLGKANLIYGLMRRQDLIGFNWEKFVQKYGTFGIDMLFVYKLLGSGRLALESSLLYGCTVGNVKHYDESGGAHQKKWLKQLGKFNQWFCYYTRYISVTGGGYKLLPIIGLPLKIGRLLLMNVAK